MSYILDALKKSERERSQGRVETLDTLQVDGPSAHTKLAILLISIITSLCIVLAGFIWYFRAEIQSLAGSSFSDEELISSQTELRIKPSTESVLDSTLVLSTESANTESHKTTDKATQLNTLEKPVDQNSEHYTDADADAVAFSSLPSSIRSTLPNLSISVLSFSDDKERRFVMLDDAIYKEGEPITNDLKLLSIEKDRLIFKTQNRLFFKTP